MKQSMIIGIFSLILLALVGSVLWIQYIGSSASPISNKETSSQDASTSESIVLEESERPQTLRDFDNTNINTATIPTDQIISGGPGKDGIPAIDAPIFVSIAETKLDDDIEGVLIALEGEERFYPLTILVWHEIVNDQIGGTPFSVTFCPLCGSAITFDRRLGDQLLDFGVSGYLYESNLLMYDRQTESFWSQAVGEAVVGELVGAQLTYVPMQQITFGQLKADFSTSVVMSTDTGHIRNYGVYPYGDYAKTERTIFPVTVSDNRFFAKEIMYVVPVGDASIAIPKDSLIDTATRTVGEQELKLVRDGGLINATLDGEPVPGYFEMWFSWATHHQDDGIVWSVEAEYQLPVTLF
jgi:hypothetical protein